MLNLRDYSIYNNGNNMIRQYERHSASDKKPQRYSSMDDSYYSKQEYSVVNYNSNNLNKINTKQ
jgi:hypothetical protein